MSLSEPAPGFYALGSLPGPFLALALLVLGVLADNHNAAFALDYLAFLTNRFHGRFNFHFMTFPFYPAPAPAGQPHGALPARPCGK